MEGESCRGFCCSQPDRTTGGHCSLIPSIGAPATRPGRWRIRGKRLTACLLSLEPLLKPVELDDFLKIRKHWLPENGLNRAPWHPAYPGYWYKKQALVPPGATLHWLVVGGESGPRARRTYLAWARHLRDQAKAAGVAFFAKQLGTAWAIENGGRRDKGDALGDFPEDLRIREWPI